MTPIDQLVITKAAALKVKNFIEEEGNSALKLRVFTSRGVNSGLQYGFAFDEDFKDGDTEVEKEGVKLLIDPVSYQYLIGAEIDYVEGVEGSRFVIRHPNDDEPPPAMSNAMRHG